MSDNFSTRRVSSEAQEYMDDHGMAGYVDKICERVMDHFHGADIHIGVYNDPEIDHRYLQVKVCLAKYPTGFMNRLGDIQCSLESLYSRCNDEGYLLLTTDFSHPKSDSGNTSS